MIIKLELDLTKQQEQELTELEMGAASWEAIAATAPTATTDYRRFAADCWQRYYRKLGEILSQADYAPHA